ncbi:caspase family protein [Candidatus Pelagibacter sp.]|nr:caspase family protein [Candidatus Pelagibacter sp.]
MKRLLAYLFIVLGLGLTFNVNAEADNYCIPKKAENYFNSIYIWEECYVYHKKVDLNTFVEFALTNALNSVGVQKESPLFLEENLKWLKKYLRKNNISKSKINKSIKRVKIAKKEPSQKQKVAKKKSENLYIERMLTKKEKLDIAKGKIKIYKCSSSTGTHFQKDGCIGDYYKKELITNKGLLNFYLLRDFTKTQIAKKEPSQTQKVVSKVKANENFKLTKNEVNSLFSSVSNCWSLPLGLPYNKDLSIKIKVNLDQTGSVIRTEILDHSKINKKGNGYLKVLAESALRAIKLCSPLKVPNGKYPLWQQIVFNFDANEVLNGIESEDTKIAKNNLLNKHIELGFNVKKEQTTKPKKKVNAVKKEPKQEEFKPKKTNQDNEAPVITIAEAITVDSQAYTLKGKVKDKSQVYLTIDGRQVDVKKGKFEFPGFVIDPSEGEVLKIVATDRWQNKSEKTINIKVEFKQTADARSYEKPNPNNIRTKTDNDKIGIIIGIEKYQALSNLDAPYANRDANAFRAYATRALGIPNKNLKVLIDNEANRSGLLKALKIWLPQMTRGKEKDIYIFFAGHGLASDDGKDLHILPQDGDPILLEETALSRIQMFDLINKVSPKSVTMFFDTCYSGQTRDERMLVAGLRPVRIVADEQDTPNNFTIFTASNYDQTSGSINEAEHGIFSYYLMKGLEGKADENNDRKITNGELISYLKDNVSQEAFTQNRQQDPMLAGDPDKILIKF